MKAFLIIIIILVFLITWMIISEYEKAIKPESFEYCRPGQAKSAYVVNPFQMPDSIDLCSEVQPFIRSVNDRVSLTE